jgi:aryl-alcohol dehydrogenase-like predicted oxidoreductase
MHYNRLGNSDLHISKASFGCMSLGEDHHSNQQLLHRAIELGINFFDTADLYQKGFNEETVGRALKPFRDKIVLATKVGNQWRKDGSGWDWNPTKKYILDAVDKSLERLQTDYIDLYQLHGGTIDDPIDETIDAFEILMKAGKIRYYGISSIRPNVIREYIQRSKIVSVMMQYSLLDRRPEESCLDLLHKNDIGVLTRGSLASGLLLGKPVTPYLTYSAGDVDRAAKVVTEISRHDQTATEVALQFVWQHPAITSAVVGIRTMDQLSEMVAAEKGEPLRSAEIAKLAGTLIPNTYVDHR